MAVTAVTAVPASAAVEMAAASPAGAACTELAEMATTNPLAPMVTLRFEKNSRNRSVARLTRFCAVSSEVPSASPTSRSDLFSKYRSSSAARSSSSRLSSASSSTGRMRSQSGADSELMMSCSMASLSFASRRRVSRRWLSAAYRALRCSQPVSELPSGAFSATDCAFRARSVNTLCATSQARSGEFTCRSAAEYTKSVCRATSSRKAPSRFSSAYSRSNSMSDRSCISPVHNRAPDNPTMFFQGPASVSANSRNLFPFQGSIPAGSLNGNSRKQISYLGAAAKPGLQHVLGKDNLHPLKRPADEVRVID